MTFCEQEVTFPFPLEKKKWRPTGRVFFPLQASRNRDLERQNFLTAGARASAGSTASGSPLGATRAKEATAQFHELVTHLGSGPDFLSQLQEAMEGAERRLRSLRQTHEQRALELLGVCAMLFGRRGNAAKREQCFWLRGGMSSGAVLGAARGSRCGAARGYGFVKSRG